MLSFTLVPEDMRSLLISEHYEIIHLHSLTEMQKVC